MWSQIIMFVLSLVISIATAPKPKNAKPAAFGDFDFPQSSEGSEQIWVFGDVWISDWMVLGIGNYKTEAIKTKSGK
ncbi:MAG: hypothetical protein LBQ81_12155 [Zoogloeaceae bacterium]|jgi:hypothetical protein|nr:hypothetical protein [Zoogloeaceae bacterium]